MSSTPTVVETDGGQYCDEVANHPLFNSSIPEIPRSLKVRSVLRELTIFRDAANQRNYSRSAHCLFWSPCNKQTKFGEYKANVMMQMRFDGTFGFPGGLIDENEDILDGLHRELKEEVNYNVDQLRPLTYGDYHSTRVVKEKETGNVYHLFVAQLTTEQFESVERAILTSQEYGIEVFGTVRVPLYTMDNAYSGLPAFLNNKFIGTAKQQLLLGLFSCGLFNNKQMDELIHNTNNSKLAPNRM